MYLHVISNNNAEFGVVTFSPQKELAAEDCLGGKGKNLARLSSSGISVPPFFVVASDVYRQIVANKQFKEKLEILLSAPSFSEEIELLFMEHQKNDELKKLIEEAVEKIARKTGKISFAVRSSGEAEDGSKHSFAGMFSSFLFQNNINQILESLCKCWASMFSERNISYMKKCNLDIFNQSMAVVIQTMIDADAAGVMFTVNPAESSHDFVVIDAVSGVGEGLVSGLMDADHFVIAKKDLKITDSYIAKNSVKLVFDSEKGCGLKEIDSETTGQAVNNELLKIIAETGIKIEKIYGTPQDIEWAVKDGLIYILQSRPVTTLVPNKNLLIWDNSNITESYSGITLPMTFSIANHFYYHVFKETLIAGGIPRNSVERIDRYLQNMLGYIDGRVYYNLLNWYNMIFLLPGLKHYKGFWEQMIGLRESLPDYAKKMLEFSEEKLTFYDRYVKLRLMLTVVGKYIFFQKSVDRFIEKVNKAYDKNIDIPFEKLDLMDNMEHYRAMLMLKEWNEPNFNDFYCFVFVGAIKKLTHDWIGPEETIHNDLLSGETDIISTEPTKLLLSIAKNIKENKVWYDFFKNNESAEILKTVRNNPEYSTLWSMIEKYIKNFGFRCMEELKFESEDYFNNPEMLVVMLKNYIDQELVDPELAMKNEAAKRHSAEELLKKKLTGFRLKFYSFVVRQARKALRNRENLRFLRTKTYGLLRRVLNGSGNYLFEEKLLDAPKDVFYLTINELLSQVDGTAVTRDLKALVALRKKELDSFAQREPDDRFISRSMVYHHNNFVSRKQKKDSVNELHGISCSPGKVSGRVKIIISPKDDMTLNGEILVAKRTDPGWVTLYPSISGLLVEKGSLVSHSIIVAREMGIPAIVSIPGLTDILKNGDFITVDATNGIVTIEKRGEQ